MTFKIGDLVCCRTRDSADFEGLAANGLDATQVYEVHSVDGAFLTVKHPNGRLRTCCASRFLPWVHVDTPTEEVPTKPTKIPSPRNESSPRKETAGKPLFEILFSLPGLVDVVQIFTSGQEKYPPIDGVQNWRKAKGDAKYKSKLIGAACRHIFAYTTGHRLDDESGRPHLAHAVCNLLMVADLDVLEGEIL